MPVLAFHLAGGLLPKAIAPRNFGYAAFVVANVLLESEPLARLALAPNNAALFQAHTWGFATLAALVATLIVWAFHPNLRMRPHLIGAIVGAYSHVLLDSIYRIEVGAELESVLLLAGIIGVATLAVRRANCADEDWNQSDS